MRLLVLSDLHLEFAPEFSCPDVACDAVLLAGDIHACGARALDWILNGGLPSGVPIIYVLGNHEFYDHVLQHESTSLRAKAAGTRVQVLSPGRIALSTSGAEQSSKCVRVLGTTLWTDFSAPVDVGGKPCSNARRARDHAARCLADFYRIGFDPDGSHGAPVKAAGANARSFQPADSAALHRIERDWLLRNLNEPFDGPTVVITHHAPSRRSIAPRFARDWLSPAFASELPPEFFKVPVLWVHGHTHTSFDYHQGACRIVCNPRGYASRAAGSENPQFNRRLVIDIAERA